MGQEYKNGLIIYPDRDESAYLDNCLDELSILKYIINILNSFCY